MRAKRLMERMSGRISNVDVDEEVPECSLLLLLPSGWYLPLQFLEPVKYYHQIRNPWSGFLYHQKSLPSAGTFQILVNKHD
jgi:hypothetical protein